MIISLLKQRSLLKSTKNNAYAYIIAGVLCGERRARYITTLKQELVACIHRDIKVKYLIDPSECLNKKIDILKSVLKNSNLVSVNFEDGRRDVCL